ncbi:MAG: hypothetical protein KatS3mg117_3315 [Geminicoccaceae bacterium]|nr:MAG: hypothetical protein KatS3mg117_3315 [Geminicoccaceae bacterium]
MIKVGIAVVASALVVLAGAAVAEEGPPIRTEVATAEAPVGRPTEILAKLTIGEGYRFIEPPPRGNRVIELSSADGGVEFARRVFRGTLEGNAITFRLQVTPTKPGPHPINGVFRVSYVTETSDSWHLRHVSLPLVTTVTGTE